jgi:TfoX/Sxy family transcriptional regulator of competence genes
MLRRRFKGKMEFQDFVCEKLKNAGEARAKKMFGTYNICMGGINLGLICENSWYLKKTPEGDAYIKENGIELETGIKGNSYIITDFSDEEMICELVKITCNSIVKSKRA